MLKFLLPIIFLTSCVTSNKVKRYMLLHPEKAAELCLEQFPQEEKHDTILVKKDSIIIEQKIDSVYTWLVEDHFVDKVVFKDKIKEILKVAHDTIKVTTIKWDDRYKVMYQKKDRDYAILEEKYNRNKKSLFYTWLWIGIVGVGYLAYKKYV
jgi:hypothetical protein